MAADLASSTQAQSQLGHQSYSHDGEPPAVLENGSHDLVEKDMSDHEASSSILYPGEPLPITQTTINLKDTSAAPEPISAGPTPIQNVSSGIQPVSSFIPKDAPRHSHPTPPPDDAPPSTDVDPDTEMSGIDVAPQLHEPAAQSFEPLPVEGSLVRPREDDDESEPAAKRSRLEVETLSKPESSATTMQDADALDRVIDTVPEQLSAVDVKPEIPDLPQVANGPQSLDASLSGGLPAETTVPDSASVNGTGIHMPVNGGNLGDHSSHDLDVKPPIDATASTDTPATATKSLYSTEPLTPAQKAFIGDKLKNLKKTKHSVFFLKPVDPVALNIPNYPDVIKQPMDLSTMESRLKDNQYASVQEFVNDFELMVGNCRRFNGDSHTVTIAALNMKAYFDRTMEQVPSSDQPEHKPAPKRTTSISKPPPRRESRTAAVAASPVATETFALQADGTPQIRRDSSINQRPARAIKPPANRELTYAKPKRKANQLELKFCEYVLEDIRGPHHLQYNNVFQAPVDPVALNIPNYRSVVKEPMDLGTMGQKLKTGQYGKASEFKKDFELMIQNCLVFNPPGNAVRDMGVGLKRDFDILWAQKEKWERANKPESQRATSASADEESIAEEEDDDEHDDDKEAIIHGLQKQLADMQTFVAGLTGAGGKTAKSKKAKTKSMSASTSTSKKIGSLSSMPAKSKTAPPKPKSKPKVKQVTYEEKQEISEAVSRMSDAQVSKLTQIITENCAKYRDMEEMELEIDDLPNDVQALLLRYVRNIFGNPNKAAPAAARTTSPEDAAAADDDDFEPERGVRGAGGAGGGRRKKHKPMGKREQGEKIKTLQSKLAQFSGGGGVGASASESPTGTSYVNPHADTSGDEESEESEEE